MARTRAKYGASGPYGAAWTIVLLSMVTAVCARRAE